MRGVSIWKYQNKWGCGTSGILQQRFPRFQGGGHNLDTLSVFSAIAGGVQLLKRMNARMHECRLYDHKEELRLYPTALETLQEAAAASLVVCMVLVWTANGCEADPQ